MSKDKSPLVELPVITPTHSYADWQRDNVFTCNFGTLIPTICEQLLPGTNVKWRSSRFGRLAPMLSPVFGKVNIFNYRFTVRNRDIATYWDSLITNGDQRLTWQQNDSQFIPPVCSQFRPLDLLLNGYFLPETTKQDNNANAYFKPVQERFTDSTAYINFINTTHVTPAVSNTTLDSTVWSNGRAVFMSGLSKKTLMYVAEFECVNDEVNFTVFPYNSGFDVKPTSLYVIFRPNYSDLDLENTENPAYPLTKDDLDFYAVNPFSPGTLLDYLGIDLTMYYRNNAAYWNDALTVLLSTWSSSSAIQNSNISLLRSMMKEFVSKRFVFCIMLNGNNQSSPSDSVFGYQLANVLGYFDAGTIDDLISNSSTAFLKTVLDDAFFNGRANSTYENTVFPLADERIFLSMLPIHAYNFVYNEWFRDQNLIPINPNCRFDVQGDFLATFLTGNTMNAHDVTVFMQYFHLRRKAWEKDQFTTALPGPQRGNAVRFLSDVRLSFDNLGSLSQNVAYDNSGSRVGGSSLTTSSPNGFIIGNGGAVHIDNSKDLFVDLSQATIENFRWANKMQEFLEIKARTGNRYFEMMQGLWGVDIDDAKINRPIYMDGNKTPVQISEVLQTSSTDVSTGQPLGDMAGRATAVGSDETLDWYQKDWAFIIEFVAVVPRVSYMRGLSKMWTRLQYLDWPWFKFAQLGEETVDKRELAFDGTTTERPFGYQSRYYDMKLKNDEVHGEFKDSLDFWQFARDFDSMPQLGQKFLEVNPPYRQFAVTNDHYHHVWLSCTHDLSVYQPLPHLPVPSL